MPQHIPGMCDPVSFAGSYATQLARALAVGAINSPEPEPHPLLLNPLRIAPLEGPWELTPGKVWMAMDDVNAFALHAADGFCGVPRPKFIEEVWITAAIEGALKFGKAP